MTSAQKTEGRVNLEASFMIALNASARGVEATAGASKLF